MTVSARLGMSIILEVLNKSVNGPSAQITPTRPILTRLSSFMFMIISSHHNPLRCTLYYSYCPLAKEGQSNTQHSGYGRGYTATQRRRHEGTEPQPEPLRPLEQQRDDSALVTGADTGRETHRPWRCLSLSTLSSTSSSSSSSTITPLTP